jgi:hypothetical protein
MKRGAIRQISWHEPETQAPGLSVAPEVDGREAMYELMEVVQPVLPPPPRPVGPRLEPEPESAAEEATALLRIAAEVEGALLVQYLYVAYSVLPGIHRDIPEIGPPSVSSDRWSDVLREIARQEMGHLITVQNLLLSLDADPHVDRENFPWVSFGLFPFPFHLEKLDLDTLAKAVTAEAPKDVTPADQADYAEAAARANAVAGPVSRVGQIYERLYFLFQDADHPQPPWSEVTNPFPKWPLWHVPLAAAGRNQDRQAQTLEWWGDGLDGSADTAIYVLPVADLATARSAIFRVAQQGEGPPDAGAVDTHFDKFLRLYREFRAYGAHPDWPAAVRNPSRSLHLVLWQSGAVTNRSRMTLYSAHMARAGTSIAGVSTACSPKKLQGLVRPSIAIRAWRHANATAKGTGRCAAEPGVRVSRSRRAGLSTPRVRWRGSLAAKDLSGS